ncbi:MAG: hypothetical protein H0T91_12040 [Propionibacteriaceae bacterium]|nr:hypothetical protein [Propionibacteriaceae bacterium]
MFRRVFWFTAGAGTAVFVVVKVRGYAKQASPKAIGSRVGESAAELGHSVRDFTASVRAAMAEREAELRDALGLHD